MSARAKEPLSRVTRMMTFVGPAVMPLVGWVIDNVPLRPLILAGVVLQSASLAAFGFMDGSVWVYYTLCLAMIVTASGASMLTLAKVLQTWFDQAFGRALGILFAVTTVGAVIHPQIISRVILHASWREAFMAMGLMSLVFIATAVQLGPDLPQLLGALVRARRTRRR